MNKMVNEIQEKILKEKLLEDIHKRAKTIQISEEDVQRMIERAKEKSIRRYSVLIRGFLFKII